VTYSYRIKGTFSLVIHYSISLFVDVISYHQQLEKHPTPERKKQ
jgi:hypothetical protein